MSISNKLVEIVQDNGSCESNWSEFEDSKEIDQDKMNKLNESVQALSIETK